MSQIYQYPTKESIDGSELLVCYDPSNSDTRKFSITALSSYVAVKISTNMSGYVTQYSAPSATGFNIYITDTKNDIHLILTPTATFANGTITLPLSSNTLDGQRVLVNCTQAVTALSVGANGATAVTGAPASLTANSFFTLKYDKVTSTWFRVG